MIVALTGLVISWGARTLGLQLEEADLGKLTSLRDSVILEWGREKDALASISAENLPVLIDTDLSQAEQEPLHGRRPVGVGATSSVSWSKTSPTKPRIRSSVPAASSGASSNSGARKVSTSVGGRSSGVIRETPQSEYLNAA